MARTTVQKVTGALRKAGFQAAKWEWVQCGTGMKKERRQGYSVGSLFRGRIIVVECCSCMEQINEIYDVLEQAGFQLDDKRANGIIGII